MTGKHSFSSVLAIILLLILFHCSSQAQTARSYYQELYKAGGLDRLADLYVCFDEDLSNENFFIFGKSDVFRDFLAENDELAKLPKAAKEELKRGFLNTRGYSKGIPFANEENYYKDGDSWVTDKVYFDKKSPVRMRLNIVWETLRYKRSVELLNLDGSLKRALPGFGRCESIPPDVPQKAN